MPTPTTQTNVAEPIELDPSLILADDNTRFGLKETRLETLMASIIEHGVMSPVEVSEMEEPDKQGHQYLLTAGHYRLEAVMRLNKDGAGISIPANLIPAQDSITRIKRQITENLERENQSPMDRAISMQRCLDEGMTKADVRDLFKIPGGRKGLKVQAISNSALNIHLSFLGLKKDIQERIHDGRITFTGAMAFVNAKPENRAAILQRIEDERIKLIDDDEKSETKLLESEAKDAKSAERLAEQEKRVAEKQSAATKAEADRKEAAEIAAVAFKDAQAIKDATLKVTADKRAKDLAESATKAEDRAKKLAEDAKKAADAIKTKAAEAQAKAKTVAKAAAKPITAKEVTQAAKAEGETPSGAVPLKRPEIMDVIKEISLPGADEKVREIGKALAQCFNGVTTDKQLYKDLLKVVGAKPAKPAKVA